MTEKRRKAKEQRRLVRAVGKRLQRGGVVDHVQRVRAAIQSELFAERFRAALTFEASRSIADLEGVRALVRRVLAEEFDCDTSDVLLTFAWNPETRALDISSHPSPVMVAAAVDADRRERLH